MASPDGTFLVTLCNFSGLGILPQHILGRSRPTSSRSMSSPSTRRSPVGRSHSSSIRPTSSWRCSAARPIRAPSGSTASSRSSPEVGLGQLETGEIDVMTLPVAERDRTAELEGVTVVHAQPEHGLPGGEPEPGVPAERRCPEGDDACHRPGRDRRFGAPR